MLRPQSLIHPFKLRTIRRMSVSAFALEVDEVFSRHGTYTENE